MKYELHDQFIILVLRLFYHDLIGRGYSISELTYNDRDGDYVKFSMFGKRILISSTYQAAGCFLEVQIIRNGFLTGKKEVRLSNELLRNDKLFSPVISTETMERVMKSYHDYLMNNFDMLTA